MFPWPALIVAIFWMACASLASAADITRSKLPSGTSPISLWADEVYTWKEGNEQVFVLGKSVLIQQDQTSIWSQRAVVWIDAEAQKKRLPIAVTVFADESAGKPVALELKSQPRQTMKAAFLEFTTPSFGRLRGKVIEQSLAQSDIYRTASAARGKPVAVPVAAKPQPASLPLQTPAANTKPPTTTSAAQLILPETAPATLANVASASKPTAPATLSLPPVTVGTTSAKVQPAQFVNPPPPPSTAPPPPLDAKEGENPPPKKGNTVIPVPISESRTLWLSPRSNRQFEVRMSLIGEERVAIITGGIKLLAKFATGDIRSLNIEADEVVIWRKGGDSRRVFDAMTTEEGSGGNDEIELYLAGNVVIRYGADTDVNSKGVQMEAKTLRAQQVYYDVNRHRAVALNADMEYSKEGYANKGHLIAQELNQIASSEFQATNAEIHASRLPSDPGIRLTMAEAVIYQEPKQARRTVFGTEFRDRLTGGAVEREPQILEAQSIRTQIRDTPIFYLPSIRTDLNDPFGPFNGVTFRQDRIFGTQLFTTWDALELLGLTKLPNESWDLMGDYLSRRGPALGTTYQLRSNTFFDTHAPFSTLVKAYAVYDQGTDILGGPRENAFQPSDMRGRFLFRHQQEFDDLTVQAQIAYLSDRNFYEQYYKYDFDLGPNEETFLWLKQQQNNAAVSMLIQPNLSRDWVAQTQWLPKVSGYLGGQSIFDMFTYNTWGSVGYAQLHPFSNPADEFPFGVNSGAPTPEVAVTTGRADWMQQLSLPLNVGPAKIVPYGVLDLAYYTRDNEGNDQGRVMGAAGVRASMPFSRLYSDVTSDLFNLNGLYHKNQFTANYYIGASNVPSSTLPQLDRLNDDASEQSWRDVTPWHPYIEATQGMNGLMLASSPIYNPRLYAIRRLVDFNPDVIDSLQVLQLGWNQRFQTKRGYPGLEHTVDWLTLDVSGSFYPTADRDNFGHNVGFLEYNMNWNVGDRNGIFSSGWIDPFDYGARYWAIGTYFQRDDRTNFSLAYRSTDPINSRIVSATATYVFSPKYAVSAVTVFDFGSQASLTNSFYFTRIGTDMQVTLGFNYNALINNFGITFGIVPNLMANNANSFQARGLGSGSPNQDRR
jgi:hypothetical protein